MMTSSGFGKLAEKLKAVKPPESHDEIAHEQWNRDLFAVCDALQLDNPNFSRGLFLAECGMFSD